MGFQFFNDGIGGVFVPAMVSPAIRLISFAEMGLRAQMILSFKMTITELEETVTQILNRLIDNPMLSDSTDSQYNYEPSLEVQRMNNDIERMIASLDSDRETTQKLITECAAKKFNEHKSARHIADRLKADLERSGPLSSYSPELFDRTVSSVTIDQNSQVQLVLKNGVIVGKEM